MSSPVAATPRVALIIPAYEPSEKLPALIAEVLSEYGNDDLMVMVVNDGSKQAGSLRTFEELLLAERVVLVHHASNRGKGAALKTGFAEILARWPGVQMLVTADADGQHLPKDIVKLLRLDAPRNLVLGVRPFLRSGMPFRSWIGNVVTVAAFAAFSGQKVTDTQTGLRALPADFAMECLQLQPNGYDFELDMLMRARRRGRIGEMPITRVYEDGNSSSHFNPLRDSALIYAVFIRHVGVTASIYVFEWALLATLIYAGMSLLASFILSRGLAIVVYFLLARNFVHKAVSQAGRQAIGFAALVAVNVGIIALVADKLEPWNKPSQIAGLIAIQLILFVANFLAQRFLVFGRRID